jgi:hypothetical protein
MKHCKLRIAWSVGCSVLCLLLIALWMRSYWRLEILEKRTGLQAVQVSSVKGRIAIGHLDPRATIGRCYLNVVAGNSADWRKKGGVLGFAYYHDGWITALIAPHWLPAVLSAALAVIPWISRSWRFSLRTLLIGMTVVAVALSLIFALSR